MFESLEAPICQSQDILPVGGNVILPEDEEVLLSVLLEEISCDEEIKEEQREDEFVICAEDDCPIELEVTNE